MWVRSMVDLDLFFTVGILTVVVVVGKGRCFFGYEKNARKMSEGVRMRCLEV